MKRPALLAVGILLAAAPALQPERVLAAEPGTIAVSGEGVVETTPDLVEIVVGVESLEATPDKAIDANSAAMTRVVDDARASGVEARDIQTSQIGLRRQVEDKNVVRFVASNTVQVRLRDTAKLGGVIRSLVGSGANDVRGLGFSVANPAPHLEKARREAVADARRKAEVLAEAAGVKLGPILEITDSLSDAPPPMPMMRAEMAAPRKVPVEAGQVAIRAGVHIRWQIAP